MTKKVNLSVHREDIEDLAEVRAYCKAKGISFSKYVIQSSFKQLRRDKEIADGLQKRVS